MITITSANQVKLNTGACIDCATSDLELGVRALVGYHNYFQVGVHDACGLVQAACTAAGLNWVSGWGNSMPLGAVRVGQVLVHHGSQTQPLYVIKRPA